MSLIYAMALGADCIEDGDLLCSGSTRKLLGTRGLLRSIVVNSKVIYEGDTMQEMGAGLPAWLTSLSWVWIAAALISAAWISRDIFVKGDRRSSKALDLVWPLAALYLGPLAVPIFNRFGQAREADLTATAVRSGLPGGVTSGLAHIVAVPFVVATGLTIANVDMWAMVALITALATAGIFAFEYLVFTSRDRRVRGLAGLRPALVVALVTVIAFDLGMLGWMLILYYTKNMPAAGDIRFTFFMQIGLILGTITVYPAMRVLVARRRTAALLG